MPSFVPSAARGTATVGTVFELVLRDSVPLLEPGTVGVNFVWTCSLSPFFRVTGNVTGVAVPLPGRVSVACPTPNSLVVVVCVLLALVLAVAPVTVTVLVAVTDTARLLVVPTAVCGRVVEVATAGADAPGAAKPRT